MNIEERVNRLRIFLSTLFEGGDQPTNIDIYSYDAEGFRIAEISFSWRNSRGVCGGSYMRSESDHAAIILAAEDYVAWYNEDAQFRKEAEEQLAWLINGEVSI